MDRLLLLLLAKSVHLVGPRVVSTLWLDELLLRLLHLLPASLLRLLVTKSILESSLLWLHASRLAVGIVQIAGLLWLLDGVTKPVHCSLLLVALVETGRLWRLAWSVIKQQVFLLRIRQLALPQFFLFFAQLQCLSQIIVSINWLALSSPRSIFLRLVLRGLERKFVLQVVVVVRCSLTLLPSLVWCRFSAKSKVFQTCDTRLPGTAILSLSTQSLLVQD